MRDPYGKVAWKVLGWDVTDVSFSSQRFTHVKRAAPKGRPSRHPEEGDDDDQSAVLYSPKISWSGSNRSVISSSSSAGASNSRSMASRSASVSARPPGPVIV